MFSPAHRIYALLIVFVLFPGPALADVTRSSDEQTGLLSWRMQEGDFELELKQLLPDQTRAFFLARGFSKETADTIANGCIMQTIGRNRADRSMQDAAMDVDLKRWRMLHSGVEGPIKLKEQWDSEWPAGMVSDAARLAFRWATFPTQQDFAVGDFGWGMTSFGLAPGERFDLHVVWSAAGVERDVWIRGIQCAEER